MTFPTRYKPPTRSTPRLYFILLRNSLIKLQFLFAKNNNNYEFHVMYLTGLYFLLANLSQYIFSENKCGVMVMAKGVRRWSCSHLSLSNVQTIVWEVSVITLCHSFGLKRMQMPPIEPFSKTVCKPSALPYMKPCLTGEYQCQISSFWIRVGITSYFYPPIFFAFEATDVAKYLAPFE